MAETVTNSSSCGWLCWWRSTAAVTGNNDEAKATMVLAVVVDSCREVGTMVAGGEGDERRLGFSVCEVCVERLKMSEQGWVGWL